MKKFKSSVFVLFVFLFSHLFLLGMDARADIVSRNGDFSAGGDQWNINPAIPATWNPFVSGSASLHPPNSYNGEVIYQNLNVTGIANKALNFSCTMTNVSAPGGNTIAFYVDYIDTASGSDKYVSERLYSPSNALITTLTPVTSNSFVFPATARKLVKFRIVKESYGEFIIDDIQLASPTGITVGTVPQITSLSGNSGNYGTVLTITGTGFGTSQGKVTIGGSLGAAITSWNNTSIAVTVNDPARSGPVVVASDFTESNIDKSYTVTSANYTVDLQALTIQVVKGEAAEFVLKVDLLNGFSTAGGISFSVSGLPGGTVSSFAPVPLKRNGGVVLRIATGTLTPGTYDLTITSSEASSASRVVLGRLIVATSASLDFYQTDLITFQQNIITSLAVTQQGSILGLNALGVDSGSKPVLNIQVTSSNPVSVGAYKNSYGTYDLYAHSSGSAILTATAPDGTTKTLDVTVNLAAKPNVGISLSPQTITNKYTDFIEHLITYNVLPEQSSIGNGIVGFINFVAGSNTLDFPFPQTTPPTYGGHFKIDHSRTQLGSYMFSGGITGASGSAENAAPLTITNDPTYAGLNLSIKSLDSSIMPQMYELFDIEFYDNAGTLLFIRSNLNFSLGDTFFIGAIDPGSYKIRLVPMSTQILPQWYPNADSASDAQLITFAAGANDGTRYFFARKAPDTTPPIVNDFTVPSTASSLIVTGIVLSGYDADSGISGYCLTETNDSAGCTWLMSSPTQYTFATSGAKTLYAFIKDTAGNVSVTDATSTKVVNIVLQFQLTLAFAGTGGGQVNVGMSCLSVGTCNPVLFTEGSNVTLVATPDTNSTFGGWSGCTSTSGTTCNVTVSAAKTVTATYVKAPAIKIMGGSAAGFATLRLAYDAASSNVSAPSTIQIRSIILPDPPISFDRSVSVTVKGGYDASFSAANSGVSTLQGPVTFKGGPVTIEKLVVE